MKVRLNDELFKHNDPNTPRIISVTPVKKPAGACRSIAEVCNDLDRYIYGTFGTLNADNMLICWWTKTPLKGSVRPADGRTYRLVTNVVIHGSEDVPVHYLIVFPFNDDERIDTDEQHS